MTEQAQEQVADGAVPAGEPSEAEAAPTAAPVAEAAPSRAEDAPPESVARPGLLRRVNPLRLFRKESPEMYLREGHSLLDNHNLAQATIAFQQALRLNPDCAAAFKGLGSVLLRKGGRSNYAAALENYREAIGRDPFDDQAYAVSAKIHEKLGQMKEATLARKKMVIVKTLHADPGNAIANNNMGILMLQQQRVAEALDYFSKSIASNPNYDVAFRNLAATHYRLAKAEEEQEKKAEHLTQARSHISRALEISRSVTSLLIHGRILVLEGRHEEALEAAGEAEGMEQANKEVYALKQQALEALNRTQEAQEAFESYRMFSRQ